MRLFKRKPEDEKGYYHVRYLSRSASMPDEIRSDEALLEYIKSRIEANYNELWTISIEKRNDWEKREKAELARLKDKYEGEQV